MPRTKGINHRNKCSILLPPLIMRRSATAAAGGLPTSIPPAFLLYTVPSSSFARRLLRSSPASSPITLRRVRSSTSFPKRWSRRRTDCHTTSLRFPSARLPTIASSSSANQKTTVTWASARSCRANVHASLPTKSACSTTSRARRSVKRCSPRINSTFSPRSFRKSTSSDFLTIFLSSSKNPKPHVLSV